MATGYLRARDAEDLLGLLRAARSLDPGPVLPWELLEGLLRLVPADLDLTARLVDHRDLRTVVVQGVRADGTRGVERAGEGALADSAGGLRSPLVGPQCRRALRRVLSAGDSHPGDGTGPRYPEVTADVPGELAVPLRAPPGEVPVLLFLRSDGTPFGGPDQRLLELARPHLLELWLDAEHRRAGVPRLTAREWEVLGLAGAGLYAEEIAAALRIAVGTVRKHTEHIREKCGTHTVAEAAARCLPYGPGPGQPVVRWGG
ncbi:LuxR C-terminal-related transcriptional regulator [Geodermatophilus sp. SYSU D01180]